MGTENKVKGTFSKNVLTLMTGTSLAQIIPLIISPLLTRLYTTEQFGAFSLFSSITTVLAVAATGRYELAILLPKDEKKAINVFLLAIAVSIMTCGLIFIVFYLYYLIKPGYLKATIPVEWLFLIPISVLLVSIYQSSYYWLNRRALYKNMALSRIIQLATTNGISLGLGIGSKGFIAINGLIVGFIIGTGVSLGAILKRMMSEIKLLIQYCSKSEMKYVAKEYINFPKILVLAHTMNSFTMQIPIFFFTLLYNPSIVGLFSLTQRTLRVPLGVISTAVGDVFRQSAAEEFQKYGECKRLYLSTLKKLALLAVIPCLSIVVFGPQLFQIVFGEEWRMAGDFARLMSVMFFFQIISNPLSNMYLIAQKQKMDLIIQLLILITNLIVIPLSYITLQNLKLVILLYAVNNTIIYAVNLLITYRLSSMNGEQIS